MLEGAETGKRPTPVPGREAWPWLASPLTQVEAAQAGAANQGEGGGRVDEAAAQLLEKAALRMQGGPVRCPGVAAGPQGAFAAHERPGVTFGGCVCVSQHLGHPIVG